MLREQPVQRSEGRTSGVGAERAEEHAGGKARAEAEASWLVRQVKSLNLISCRP